MNELQERYLSFLEEKNPEIREAGTKGLYESLNPAVVEALLVKIQEPHFAGLLEAIWLLGKSEETRATEVLLDHLKHPDARVRELVANALTEIGDVRALQPLIEALDDPQLEVQEAASIALGELRDSRAVTPLAELLDRSDDQQVAACALAVIGDKRAVDPLIHKIETTENMDLKAVCIRSLGRFQHPSIPPLLTHILAADPPVNVMSETIKVIGEQGVLELLPTLLHIYRTTDIPRIKLVTAVALCRLGDDDPEAYLTQVLLEDSDWSRRLSAMMGLLAVPSPETIEALRLALSDEHWLIQKQAALSLMKLLEPDAYLVIQTYTSHEEDDLIQALIESSFSIDGEAPEV